MIAWLDSRNGGNLYAQRLARILGPKDDLACLANPAECTMIPTEAIGV